MNKLQKMKKVSIFLLITVPIVFILLVIASYTYSGNIFLNMIIPGRNEYIIDPDLPMYKKYEWATWKDSVGGRMAHDPKWFIMPAEKYVTKEVPFDWSKYRFKSAVEKRDAYFEHLCKTETINVITPEYPKEMLEGIITPESTWFYPRRYEDPVKDMRKVVNGNIKVLREILNIANQNPYITPNFGFKDWGTNLTLDFSFKRVDDEYYANKYKYFRKDYDTLAEYMMTDGTIYRISYDAETGKYLPLEKVDLENIKSQYYSIKREIERPEMKKLGIYATEGISFDMYNNKLVKYGKTFIIPLYAQSMRGVAQSTPIMWDKGNNCSADLEDIKTVQQLEK